MGRKDILHGFSKGSSDLSEKPGLAAFRNFITIELCSFCHSRLKAFKIKCLYKASSQILKAGCSLYCKSGFVLLPFHYRENMQYQETNSKSKLREFMVVLEMKLSEVLCKHIH